MSDLTIQVDPVSEFEDFPLAFAVDEPTEKGLLYQGAIQVGGKVKVEVDSDEKPVRVRLLLPLPKARWKTLTMMSLPGKTVTFCIANELQAASHSVSKETPPHAFVTQGDALLLSSDSAPEFINVWSDSFLTGSELHDVNFSLASQTPIAPNKRRTLLHTLSTPFPVKQSISGMAIRVVMRPFVRLWRRPGIDETTWQIDPDATDRIKDAKEGIRLVSITAKSRSCLEIGSPSGPNQFVHCPPGPVALQLRCFNIPGFGAGIGGIELAVRAGQDINLLLALTRSGAIAESRAVATLIQAVLPTTIASNKALVLAYCFLRSLDFEKVGECLNFVAKEHPDWTDLKVIQGWNDLRKPQPLADTAQAAFISAAMSPGPPTYTEGLRLLTDGLELFYYEPRVEKTLQFQTAFARARHWAAAADWDKTLTTLSGNQPDVSAPSARHPFVLREVFPLF